MLSAAEDGVPGGMILSLGCEGGHAPASEGLAGSLGTLPGAAVVILPWAGKGGGEAPVSFH